MSASLSDNPKFHVIPCPVCGGEDLKPRLEIPYGRLKQKQSLDYAPLGVTSETVLRVVRCASCRFVFVNPRFRPEFEKDLYNQCKKNMYRNKPELLALGTEENHNASRKKKLHQMNVLLAVLARVDCGRPLTLVDYGCGFGYALALARELGIVGYGVDIDEERLAVCERAGLRVAPPEMFAERFPGIRADLVLMESNIEHLIDPNATFRFVRRLCRDGAVVYVDGLTPRIIALEERRNRFVKAHFLEHVNYFPIRTLDRFMSRYGFRPMSFGRTGTVTSWKELVRFAGAYGLIRLCGENLVGGNFHRFYRFEEQGSP